MLTYKGLFIIRRVNEYLRIFSILTSGSGNANKYNPFRSGSESPHWTDSDERAPRSGGGTGHGAQRARPALDDKPVSVLQSLCRKSPEEAIPLPKGADVLKARWVCLKLAPQSAVCDGIQLMGFGEV